MQRQLVTLAIVVGSGIAAGRVAERLKYPQLFAMLLTGVILRNISTVFPSIPHAWTTPLWSLALTAASARAGLALNFDAFKNFQSTVLLIGSVPVIAEGLYLSYLASLPPAWAYTLSFGVASVSPGVVVPLLLNFLEAPTTKHSRVPTILLAATGIDVLISTMCFGVSVSSIFSHKHESNDYLHTWYTRSLEELLLGIGIGFWISILGYSAKRLNIPELYATYTTFLFCWGGMMTTKYFGFPGAASCLVIVCFGILANIWEKEWIDASNKRLKVLWNFAEPFLFPVIGFGVVFNDMSVNLVFGAAACVVLSITFRVITTFLATLATVTVEAVHVLNMVGTKEDEYSKVVFACMVSAIVIGGPVSAAWADWFGHYLIDFEELKESLH